ncbi:Elongation of fatty acids protein 2 [Coelomomyces lativittatus]|nr:Elongation of fatty acids protein 2 [Coelomomyces lativittatus]
MGIHGLTKLLGDQAPQVLQENEIKNYFGRKIAIDASMAIYQFLIAVRNEGQMLTNDSGETTSHLIGMFYRTIRMLDNGIKPVYVFDGKPPELKSIELEKRFQKRTEATASLEEAIEKGATEDIDKFSRRTVKVTRVHTEECKRLLTLMGVPYLDAPSEAEAQCAALCREGLVYATGSEDMDTLTFGSPILLRHLTFSDARKLPISEIHLEKVLLGLHLSMEQFIDLCILLGCDYCSSIPGVGPKTAFQWIQQHHSIEAILPILDKKKHGMQLEDWLFKEARQLFKKPNVLDPSTIQLKWNDPDEEGLIQYLVKEKNFNEERIRTGIKKILKSKGGGTQERLDTFFKPLPSTNQVKRKITNEDVSNSKKLKPTPKKGGSARKGRPPLR